MEDIIQLLHRGGYSCVIKNNGKIKTFTGRGVKDLYELYNNDADFLDGAVVADKVVGKAAASLMILGKIAGLYTDLISIPALNLLHDNGNIHVTFQKKTAVILNRDQSDWCPLETLSYKENSPENILPLISGFMQKTGR